MYVRKEISALVGAVVLIGAAAIAYMYIAHVGVSEQKVV